MPAHDTFQIISASFQNKVVLKEEQVVIAFGGLIPE
jgi:hypothetical protein